MSENNIDMNVLNFRDMTVIKQFLTKGLREDFFNNQEINYANILNAKIDNILQEAIKRIEKQNS